MSESSFKHILFYYNEFFLQNDEMLEIYSFDEIEEITLNVFTFLQELKEWNLNWTNASWKEINENQRKYFYINLFDKLDMCDSNSRITSLRCILYLVQGCPVPGRNGRQFLRDTQVLNTIRLYEMDVLTLMVEQLNIELSKKGPKKRTMTNADNAELRLILSILYIITEVFYLEKENPDSKFKSLVDSFVSDISNPLYDDELLANKLWTMIDDYVQKDYCHYPLKKVILLLLKVTVVSLGGFPEIDVLKNEYRKTYGLKNLDSSTDTEKFNLKSKQDYEYLAKTGSRKSYPIVARKFLKTSVKKHCNFEQHSAIDIHNIQNNLYGLPKSIEENFEIFNRNLYISLADIHREQEENFVKHPLTQSYHNQNPRTEILYSHIVTHLHSYFTSLMKILFKCMQINRNNTKSLVLSRQEILRQDDIIMYSILIITILYLKHFKLNNVYQFEYLSQIIEFNHFILVSTNFFNSSCIIEFVCGIPYEQDLRLDNQAKSSKRRMTVVLTTLQILNKLTKWKPYRIAKLIKCLSVNTYKRLLTQIQNPIMKYHLLKLIKMQIKFLGKKWKNSNLKVISDIYKRLNLFLNDDYSQPDLNLKIFDSSENEEQLLKQTIYKYNQKHYLCTAQDDDWNGGEELLSEINNEQLHDDFKCNYEVWLNDQVYNSNFEWDQLILTVE